MFALKWLEKFNLHPIPSPASLVAPHVDNLDNRSNSVQIGVSKSGLTGKNQDWRVSQTQSQFGQHQGTPFHFGEGSPMRDDEIQQLDLDADTVHQIPEPLARRFRIIPVSRSGDCLTVLCTRPLSNKEIDAIKVLANETDIEFVTNQEQYPKFNTVKAKLDDLLNHFFPPETDIGMLTSPQDSPWRQ